MAHETEFIKQLHSTMSERDRAIIEVRTATHNVEQGGSEHLRKQFNFTPLELVGVSFEPSKLTWDSEEGLSNVHDTQTVVGCYGPYKLPWDKDKHDVTTQLTFIHHYQPKEVEAYLGRRFDLLEKFYSEYTGIFVVKKKASQSPA